MSENHAFVFEASVTRGLEVIYHLGFFDSGKFRQGFGFNQKVTITNEIRFVKLTVAFYLCRLGGSILWGAQ